MPAAVDSEASKATEDLTLKDGRTDDARFRASSASIRAGPAFSGGLPSKAFMNEREIPCTMSLQDRIVAVLIRAIIGTLVVYLIGRTCIAIALWKQRRWMKQAAPDRDWSQPLSEEEHAEFDPVILERNRSDWAYIVVHIVGLVSIAPGIMLMGNHAPHEPYNGWTLFFRSHLGWMIVFLIIFSFREFG